MREKTVTVREGEYLGPVDDGYDFESHDWDHGGSTNPECIQRGREFLRRLQGPGEWEATTDGGMPRCGWGRVLRVGMYDGWPFWRPVPSVLIAGPFGAEWHWFGAISEIRQLQQTEE